MLGNVSLHFALLPYQKPVLPLLEVCWRNSVYGLDYAVSGSPRRNILMQLLHPIFTHIVSPLAYSLTSMYVILCRSSEPTVTGNISCVHNHSGMLYVSVFEMGLEIVRGDLKRNDHAPR